MEIKAPPQSPSTPGGAAQSAAPWWHPRQWVEGPHASVIDELALDNLVRIQRLLLIILGVNLVCVAVFRPTDDIEDLGASRWTQALFASHLAMAMSLVALALVAQPLLRRPEALRGLVRAYSVLAFVVVMGFIVAMVSFDQWVTSSIAPLMMACALAGTVIQMRPATSSVLYLGTYLVFAVAVGQTQQDATALMSNRVNGLSAVAMGWLLSMLSWRKSVENLLLTRRLAELATRDGLTQLYNHRETVRRCQEELSRALRHQRPTSVLVLDLDHFKQINDRHGHPAGDAVLAITAARLSDGVRSTDIVGRMGGEEFMVMLLHTDARAAGAMAENLRLALSVPMVLPDGRMLEVSASIGVATTQPERMESFDMLYQRADQALYRAKNGGRDRWEAG